MKEEEEKNTRELTSRVERVLAEQPFHRQGSCIRDRKRTEEEERRKRRSLETTRKQREKNRELPIQDSPILPNEKEEKTLQRH